MPRTVYSVKPEKKIPSNHEAMVLINAAVNCNSQKARTNAFPRSTFSRHRNNCSAYRVCDACRGLCRQVVSENFTWTRGFVPRDNTRHFVAK